MKKEVSRASVESPPMKPLLGSLPLLMTVCGGGLPFIGLVGKRT